MVKTNQKTLKYLKVKQKKNTNLFTQIYNNLKKNMTF